MLRFGFAALCLVVGALPSDADAQTRCDPTPTRSCPPPPPVRSVTPPPSGTTTGTSGTTTKTPKEVDFSDLSKPERQVKPNPINEGLPDMRLDSDTSMGFGHGGVFGVERKF